MSFLEHLDELRSRLIRSLAFVFIAATLCWFHQPRPGRSTEASGANQGPDGQRKNPAIERGQGK